MNKTTILKPFSTPFLMQFLSVPDLLPFKDPEIIKLDQELSQYEQLFLNPDLEKHLISRNELLTSFAISKAEASALTLNEAQEVYNLVVNNKENRPASQKVKKGQKLTQKDYEKLEFFNIVKTFRRFNNQSFTLNDLTPEFIQVLHKELTQGLDIFKRYLPGFEIYKSGEWRDNNLIRVGRYIPADFSEIKLGVKELIYYVEKNRSVTSIAVFHTALYALHPFNNGNKRVSRILEHILLRSIGLNKKNLYSSSYYYHKEKDRYYKYLLYSLERKNLNHFVTFILEALVLSIVSVVQISLQSKRNDFLRKKPDDIKAILKPLIKRRELQFKHLFSKVKQKMARQTFVNYLQQAVNLRVVEKRELGRSTYYRLNLKTVEEKTLSIWLKFVQSRLPHIPDDIRLI